MVPFPAALCAVGRKAPGGALFYGASAPRRECGSKSNDEKSLVQKEGAYGGTWFPRQIARGPRCGAALHFRRNAAIGDPTALRAARRRSRHGVIERRAASAVQKGRQLPLHKGGFGRVIQRALHTAVCVQSREAAGAQCAPLQGLAVTFHSGGFHQPGGGPGALSCFR